MAFVKQIHPPDVRARPDGLRVSLLIGYFVLFTIN